MKTSENRQHKRYVPEKEMRVDFYYDVQTKVEFEQDEEKKPQRHEGISKNISTHGLCFASDVQLKRGEHLNLEVHIPLQDKPVSMEGRVCWSEHKGAGDRYDTGVEIESVEGKEVEQTIYHDETYDVDWSEVLESVLGQYRILAQQERKNKDAE